MKVIHWTVISMVAVILGLGSQARVRAAEGASSDAPRTYWFQVLEEYRFRSASSVSAGTLYGASEQDQTARIYGAGGWQSRDGAWRVDGSFGAWYDLDGPADEGTPTAFASIYDDSSSLWLDVYSLSGEYRGDGLLQVARAGRQVTELGLPATFDGLTIGMRPSSPVLDLYLFGGRTHHFFERDAALFEDYLGSAAAVIRPASGLRLELDYRFLREDTELESGLNEHSYGLTGWYHPLTWLFLKAQVRGLDQELSHTGLKIKGEWAESLVGFDLGVESQLADLTEIAEEANPYFAILGTSLAHTRWDVSLWKGFVTSAGSFNLTAGWNGRKNHGSEEAFNRDYGKLYLLLSASDLFTHGPFISVSLEDHFASLAPGFDGEGLLAAGGSLGYDVRWLKVEAGTWFHRFKYDYYRDVREVENVRTLFAGVGWKATEWLNLKARYTMETLDRDVHTALISLTQTF